MPPTTGCTDCADTKSPRPRPAPLLAAEPDRTEAIEPSALVARRYDRVAPVYDLLESCMELRGRAWRRDLWADVPAARVLEIGVGTGKNIPLYPREADLTAIDISERMLERARRRAARCGSPVRLEIADAQRLPYASGSFDVAVATYLLCSVPDPVQALREVRRVLVPGGRLLLLEHVLSERPLLRRLMRALDPLTVRLWGAHLDRETVASVRTAGFVDMRVSNLALDVVRRIDAAAPDGLTPISGSPPGGRS